MSYVADASVPGLGLSKMVFEVTNADEALEHVSSLGATVVAPPHDVMGCRVLIIEDPDGMHIDLIEYLPDGGAWGGRLGRPEIN